MIIQVILTVFEVIFIVAALLNFANGNSAFLFFIMFAFVMIIVKNILNYGNNSKNANNVNNSITEEKILH